MSLNTPELEDGRVNEVSAKSDVYSLGKLLYWLLRGDVFSREKHRDLGWDLKGPKKFAGSRGDIWSNAYMEHVNRLLDFMIVAEPKERRYIDDILSISKEVTRLIEKEFNPIGIDIPQRCIYCGWGHYQLRAANSTQVQNFGLTLVGAPEWRIMVCDTCGHVQFFRVDIAQMKEWWGAKSM